jgi:sporulation protein YlmC with PRC-barrel domain
MVTSDEQIRQRSSVLGIQVISQSTAKRLGIVTEIWVDMNQRQIMGFTVTERTLPGTAIGFGDTFYMAIEDINLLGPDAILVDTDRVLQDILVSERYSNLIGSEVVTESGEVLGKVRDFQFDPENGDLLYLVLSSLGLPQIPAQFISTYLLDVNEVIAVGRERIVVTEGMEERMEQLTKGILETLGLGKPPWEQEFEDDYLPPTTVSGNALGSGRRENTYPKERPVYRREETWEEEDNWQEERIPIKPPERRRRIEPEPPRRERDNDYYENTQQQIQSAWAEDVKQPEELEEL